MKLKRIAPTIIRPRLTLTRHYVCNNQWRKFHHSILAVSIDSQVQFGAQEIEIRHSDSDNQPKAVWTSLLFSNLGIIVFSPLQRPGWTAKVTEIKTRNCAFMKSNSQLSRSTNLYCCCIRKFMVMYTSRTEPGFYATDFTVTQCPTPVLFSLPVPHAIAEDKWVIYKATCSSVHKYWCHNGRNIVCSRKEHLFIFSIEPFNLIIDRNFLIIYR